MSIPNANIKPHRITKPIQLLAVWFSALVAIEIIFFMAADKIDKPAWLCPAIVISAIIFVLLVLVFAFIMQTKFRHYLQDDDHFLAYKKWEADVFNSFKPENKNNNMRQKEEGGSEQTYILDLEKKRTDKYELQRGLFLIHAWRPSKNPSQVADIVVWLHQHGDGPLSRNDVDRVEYQFGPKFFDGPIIKRNANEKFKVSISAYGPLLCLARAYIKGRNEHIELERYIDFEEIP